MKKWAYYNDSDPVCCAWLRELMKHGLIMEGEVDERSISDVKGDDVKNFIRVGFFSGIGGWERALQLANWPATRPVWHGSCPCQPLSCAGKQKGHKDERHLWPEFYRLICECRPDTVFGEQVASRLGLEWIDGVSLDLEEADFAVWACDLPAAGVGAPHIRQRLWWVANDIGYGWCARRGGNGGDEPNAASEYDEGVAQSGQGGCGPWRAEPEGQFGGSPLNGSSSSSRLADMPSAGLERRSGCGETGPENADAGRSNFWSNAIWHPCLDGKTRRIPDQNVSTIIKTEPAIFLLFSDGVSAILGSVWSESINETEKEIIYYAEKSKARPGEVLRALWCYAAQKTLWREDRGYDSFSTTQILLIALCVITRHQEQKDWPTTSNITDIEERTLRILWENTCESTTSSCSSHQWGLERSSSRKYSDSMCGVPFKFTQEEMPAMRCLRREGQEEKDVSEAFSTVEKIWESAFNKKTERKLLQNCFGWANGLACFPLSENVPGRVGLLKGAGNAIVPEVAAEFIKAVMS